MSIRIVKLGESIYPVNLRNIHAPPETLFVNGELLDLDSNAVAIVGTRTPTHYGLEQSERLACALAARGITVVSGLARGIDSAAHSGALKGGGRTIAVLGSGHGNIYPPENKPLYDRIISSGAVISEFSDETPPFRGNFPRRNRIISGLAKGVLVIEAPERSGALITANFACEQNREVFAVPGNISSSRSGGTNKLIKEGAKLVETVDDIIEELESVLVVSDALADHAQVRDGRGPLSSEEERLLGLLEGEPKSIDEISDSLSIDTRETSRLLINLELKRFVRALPGENFVAVNKRGSKN